MQNFKLCLPWLWLGLAFGGPVSAQIRTTDQVKISLWSEFVPYATVETVLPELQSRGIDLIVAVHGDDPDLDGFAKLYRAAEAQGVVVKPWLLLRQQEDYWFNKWNVEASMKMVNSFIAEMANRGVHPTWVVWDIETPQSLNNGIRDKFAKWDILGVYHLLKLASRKGSIIKAVQEYSREVELLHKSGIRVQAVVGNWILHDVKDNARRFQSAFGTPLSGVPWDQVSFMIYRVEFAKLLGRKITSKIVYEYAKRAHKFFGAKASIAVGEVGHVSYPLPFQGFDEPKDLSKDMSAALAGGIKDLSIYSLDGMMEKGIKFWLQDSPKPEIPFGKDELSVVSLFYIDIFRGFLPRGR